MGMRRLDVGFAPSELAELVTRMDTGTRRSEVPVCGSLLAHTHTRTRADPADEGFVTVADFVAYLSPAEPLEPAAEKTHSQRAFLRLAGRVASMRGRDGRRWFETAELTLEGADRHQTGTLPREAFEDGMCSLEAGPPREEATELFASLCGSLHPKSRAPYPRLLHRLRREVAWRRAHFSRLRAALRDTADVWRSMHAPWLPRAAAEATWTAGESRTNRTLARTGSMGPQSTQHSRTTRTRPPPRTFGALWRTMDSDGRGAVGIEDIAVAYARCGAIAHAQEAVVRAPLLPAPWLGAGFPVSLRRALTPPPSRPYSPAWTARTEARCRGKRFSSFTSAGTAARPLRGVAARPRGRPAANLRRAPPAWAGDGEMHLPPWPPARRSLSPRPALEAHISGPPTSPLWHRRRTLWRPRGCARSRETTTCPRLTPRTLSLLTGSRRCSRPACLVIGKKPGVAVKPREGQTTPRPRPSPPTCRKGGRGRTRHALPQARLRSSTSFGRSRPATASRPRTRSRTEVLMRPARGTVRLPRTQFPGRLRTPTLSSTCSIKEQAGRCIRVLRSSDV